MPSRIRDLTRRIASGDTEAFAVFYQTWFDVALGQARALSRRDESFCLDVVQDAMMRVIRAVPIVDEERELRAWLRAVVRSCAADRLRSEIRRTAREQAPARAAPATGGGGASASVSDARLEWLRQELQRLEPSEKELLLMRHRFGWTLERIGRAIGLRPGAVDGRLSRLVAAIRRRASEESCDE